MGGGKGALKNTELSEFFGPHRVPAKELSQFLSAHYLCDFRRTRRVFFRRAQRVCCRTLWVLSSETVLSKQNSARFPIQVWKNDLVKFKEVKTFVGRTARGRALQGGVLGTFWKAPSQNPFWEPFSEPFFYCKSHSRQTPFSEPFWEPFPRTLSRTFSEPFLERCVAVPTP